MFIKVLNLSEKSVIWFFGVVDRTSVCFPVDQSVINFGLTVFDRLPDLFGKAFCSCKAKRCFAGEQVTFHFYFGL